MPHIRELIFEARPYPPAELYPFNLPLLKTTKKLEFQTPITFFAGENGTGKSTVLRAICRGSGIHIWEGEKRRRYSKSPFESSLHHFLSIVWNNGSVPGSYFSPEIFRNWAEALDDFAASDPGMLKYFGGRSLMSQSHGQALLSFFRSRYSIRGLYLLDEPEAALSPRSQIEMIKILLEASSRGDAQFIIATHSPILLACPSSVIYSFDNAPLTPIPYEETDYYTVYREFLRDRGRYLKQDSEE
jgi:predicted ATPase